MTHAGRTVVAAFAERWRRRPRVAGYAVAAVVGIEATLACVGGEIAGSVSRVPAAVADDDWPCWRGLNGDNCSTDSAPPLHWSVDQGVAWRIAAPGRGHASPCVVGDAVILASADEDEPRQFLVAFDRATGRERWQATIRHELLPTINAKNSHASATPASDGRHVYALFATAEQVVAAAVDLTGQVVWQTPVCAYRHANGLGASPILFQDLVIAVCDSPADPQIVALDCRTGDVRWRTQRTASENSGSPILAQVAGRPQLVVNGAYGVFSYDPATGQELWQAPHKTEVAACTVAFDADNVFASGNVPESLMLAVRADGVGDVSATHVLWQTSEAVTYVPSPLAVGDRLFVVTDSGVAYCRNSASGKVLWKKRLGGNFSASPVFAVGRIYATNEAGVTYVFAAADRFELLASNDLQAACLATPAYCGGRAYVRTESELICISGSPGPP